MNPISGMRTKMRHWFAVIIVVTFGTIVSYIWGIPGFYEPHSPTNDSPPIADRSKSNDENTDSSTIVEKKKLILSWTKFFGAPLDDKYFDNCPDLRRNCTITTDRNESPNADALVFHPRDMDWDDVPRSRRSNQRYVFLMHESPYHTCVDLDRAPAFFNWSLTYRLDSDVPFPYTYLGLVPSSRHELDAAAIWNKNQSTAGRGASIVWMASNCNTASRREIYVEYLRKYIPIDIYGKCGRLKCPRDVNECESMIEKRYKFYVAFENSICIDYVTEKYYARRRYNSIPLVLSRRVAEPLFPPHSFIAADDFADGPRQLADYLRYLDGNRTAYLEYFHWRTIGYDWVGADPRTGMRFGFCGLCERLLQERMDRVETKVFTSVDSWWGTNASCDGDLVRRLLAKEMVTDPNKAKRFPPYSSAPICGA